MTFFSNPKQGAVDMTTQKLPFEFKIWQQLSDTEKKIVIDKVRNAKPEDHYYGLLTAFDNFVNTIVDLNIQLDGEDIEATLSNEFGITAGLSYSFYSQGSGLCFDSTDVDEYVLFKKFNYKGLFDNTDEDYLLQLRNYITQITVKTYRVNHHYDHENSVRFSVRNHNETAADLLEAYDYDRADDEASYATTTEFQLFQKFEEAFVPEEIKTFLDDWMHTFCLENHAQLEKNFDLGESVIFEMFEEMMLETYPIEENDEISGTTIVNEPEFIFVNDEENIDIVRLIN